MFRPDSLLSTLSRLRGKKLERVGADISLQPSNFWSLKKFPSTPPPPPLRASNFWSLKKHTFQGCHIFFGLGLVVFFFILQMVSISFLCRGPFIRRPNTWRIIFISSHLLPTPSKRPKKWERPNRSSPPNPKYPSSIHVDNDQETFHGSHRRQRGW